LGTVSELTGYDRVMVYRFDERKCGTFVVKYVNPLVSEDLFVGLHFLHLIFLHELGISIKRTEYRFYVIESARKPH
jgi:hypothetical protein